MEVALLITYNPFSACEIWFELQTDEYCESETLTENPQLSHECGHDSMSLG